MTDPTRTAQQLVPFAKGLGKPVMASWMGGQDVEAGAAHPARGGHRHVPVPGQRRAHVHGAVDLAAGPRVAVRDARPCREDEERVVHRDQAREVIAAARASRPHDPRRVGVEGDPGGLRHPHHGDAHRAERGRRRSTAADAIGYPVVLKLVLPHHHPQDRRGRREAQPARRGGRPRGVRRASEQAVAEKKGLEHFEGVTVQPMIDWAGYELIVGIVRRRASSGPVLLFGLGGQLVEVFKDRALGLPPLTNTLARRMLERTRIFEALKGVRGRDAVDIAALEQLLVRFSELVVEHPEIAEIDINPLLASADRLLALDARVILHPADLPAADLPRPAIRPYPLPVRGHLDRPHRRAASHPTHPAGGRDAAGRLPPDAVGAVDLPALLREPGPRPAHRPRAADPGLLHRLRPGAGARRGAGRPGDRQGAHRGGGPHGAHLQLRGRRDLAGRV